MKYCEYDNRYYSRPAAVIAASLRVVAECSLNCNQQNACQVLLYEMLVQILF